MTAGNLHQYFSLDFFSPSLSPILMLMFLDRQNKERDRVDNICHHLLALRLNLRLLVANAEIEQNNCSIHRGLLTWYGVIIPVKPTKGNGLINLLTGRKWRASKTSDSNFEVRWISNGLSHPILAHYRWVLFSWSKGFLQIILIQDNVFVKSGIWASKWHLLCYVVNFQPFCIKS